MLGQVEGISTPALETGGSEVAARLRELDGVRVEG